MFVCSPSDVLSVWEGARGMSHPERALALTALADPARSEAERGAWTVGRRDRVLLALRASLFGERCTGIAVCPQCGEHAEIAFDISDLHVSADEPLDTLRVVLDSYAAVVRLPTAGDMVAVAATRDADHAGRLVLERCVQEAREGEAKISAAQLPARVIEEIGRAMSDADPQADLELALACPHCTHTWNAAFDIASYLWSEVHAWCVRTLQDIHEIAQAYHWREAEIIALSPLRRQAYLDMIRA